MNDIRPFVKGRSQITQSVRSFSTNLNYLEKNSYFINTISFRIFASNNPYFREYSNFVIDGYTNTISWNEQKKVMKNFVDFTKINANQLLVVTFPFLQQKREDYTFEIAHQKLEAFWKSEQIPHLDLLETYSSSLGKDLTVNNYDAHPNEYANKLAAEAIHGFIKTTPAAK